ncbi:MAG TPA: sigma-54 dependent transcriptional regulator [Terracidiphilus sp.]|nr:sigma-54 dependent transcriptional regulator [Terracidiphilus sp.]
MQVPFALSSLSPSPAPRTRPRTALLISSDVSFRRRLAQTLTGLRWQVREAASGAEAWAEADTAAPEAVILDAWLPDLELAEFMRDFRGSFPRVDVLTTEGQQSQDGPRSPHRQELLYALRMSQDTDTAAWNTAPDLDDARPLQVIADTRKPPVSVAPLPATPFVPLEQQSALPAPYGPVLVPVPAVAAARPAPQIERLPELIGNAGSMLEVSRRIRLVAPRSTPVLIEGPTGSGKELVAEALHRLSPRSRKPFFAINCAAIPEALLEAELFGHTRGAFTGAVQGRMGRIEAADGGTLFLDEIGEMPLALQAKLLRFVECGELQRVGDNETVRVDVRVVAATHRQLAKSAAEGTFRSDLYFRLAVFLIRTPALIAHVADLPLLVSHILEKLGRTEPVKRIDEAAMTCLMEHPWPGNVRELEHVLERGAILAGESATITAAEIDFGAEE